MEYIRPFGPKPTNSQNTVNLAVGTSSGSVALVGTPGQGYQSVRIVNSGNGLVFLEFSTEAGTASTTVDMCMLGNTVEVFWLPKPITHVNAIALATGNTIYCTVGEGV
jgi:hypothetical protein